jgi:hypothetical protein
MSELSEIAKWRAAHPTIEMPDEGLKTAAPFPSLRLTEFMVYMDSKDDKDAARYIRDLRREITWTYDGWAKALHYSVAKRIIADLLNNATAVPAALGNSDGPHYVPIRQFLIDYAKANGIPLPGDAKAEQGYDFLGSGAGHGEGSAPPPLPDTLGEASGGKAGA